jgi:hypothetical protein
MPTISTQTDECVDVISRLNDEYDELAEKHDELNKNYGILHMLYADKKKLVGDILVMACEHEKWGFETKKRTAIQACWRIKEVCGGGDIHK